MSSSQTDPKKPFVLDCTLRDGGYYTNWDFSLSLVQLYLQSMEAAQVDAIELGFRSPPKKGRFVGAFGYSTDEFLNELPLPKNIMKGVMINAKDYLMHKDGPEKAIACSFQESSQAPIQLVRIAAHFKELESSEVLASSLKKLGYTICLNVMQVGGKSTEQLSQASKLVSSWNAVDVLYFADSFGNMSAHDVIHTIEAFQTHWSGKIGVHAHNNMGQALNNSLVALQKGAAWVDGTVLGMGRGAGNTCTEYLLQELNDSGFNHYQPKALFNLVIEEFETLKQKFKWGPSLVYYLSAKYCVHPTYAQEMLKFNQYNPDQIIAALNYLKDNSGSSYNNDSFEKALNSQNESHEGSWSPKNWAKDKEILILGSGPGTKEHAAGIKQYIQKNNPIVISLNTNSHISPELVTAYACSHKTRILLDVDQYVKLNKKVIAPLGMIPPSLRNKYQELDVLDYGLEIERNTFKASETSCTLPNDLVLGYVLAACTISGAQRLLLAGFDGYSPTDPRQDEVVRLINLYKKLPHAVPLVAVTQSTYPVEQSSIYSPEV